MNDGPTFKKDWVITREAFDFLLSFLDSDRERAAEKYEELRRVLIDYLERWGSPCPADHADEALNRTARQLAEGLRLDRHRYRGYFCRVAHNVLLEHIKRQRAETSALRELERSADSTSEEEEECAESKIRLDCLRKCLRALSDRDRELIESYSSIEGAGKIEARKAESARRGMTVNAMRIKVHRIRGRLEKCVHDCCDGERRG